MGIEDFININNNKINSILKFTAEVDKMTGIYRKTMLIDESRRENDAEHSWHIALMAILFADFAPNGTDINRAVKMCIVHDLIEIYAGDTFAYDKAGNLDKKQREAKAADLLFNKLPDETGTEIRTLWVEFDEMKSNDAKYAACMDRLQPFLHNTLTNGYTWVEGKVHRKQIEERLEVVKQTLPEVYEWVDLNIKNAVEKGWVLEK